MRARHSGGRRYVPAIVALICVAGCAPPSPDEIVIEGRTEFIIDLENWTEWETGADEVREERIAFEPATATEAVASASLSAAGGAVAAEGETAAEGEEAAEESEEIEEPQGPRTTNVMFELLIRFNGAGDPLPGITADILHRDPFGREKARQLEWVDTSGMRRGEPRQFSFELEIDDFETGDVFAVELRSYVPPEERGEYREFSEATP
ncbi:MAG: hypothetical protein MJB57_00705 [Gemmatimonadetes bacterium]|nr:hypothetical protein [Gemmatimonadota bacterium]